MAKVKGPLLSLSANGQIGKSVVFASWRGVPYARQHVSPANPRTVAQTLTRNVFQYADDQFKRMLTLAQSVWEAAAKGKPFTARNRFISRYVSVLRAESDFTDYVASPGVNGGLPLIAFSAVTGSASGEIDVSSTIPPVPVNWTHDAVIYTAFKDRAPNTQMTDFMVEDEDLAASWTVGPPRVSSVTLTGLTPSADYVCSAFLRSTRADGVICYGISSTAIAAADA
jgi:hypothetical protein